MAFEKVFAITNRDVVYPGDPEGNRGWNSAPVAYYRDRLRKKGMKFSMYLSSLNPSDINRRVARGEQKCVAMCYTSGHSKVNNIKIKTDGGLMHDCCDGGDFVDFSKAYKNFSVKMKPFRNKRVFFVNSCNYAHHYSALFSRWAFENHGKAGNPSVILNIDQHCDCSGGKSVNNSSWGNWLFHYHPQRYSPYGAFLALGTEDYDRKKSWAIRSGAKVTTRGLNDGQVKAQLQQAVQNKKITECDLYISLDRDVFTHAITSFKPGKKTWKYVRESIVEPVLGALPGYRIVGSDITGLPSGRRMEADRKRRTTNKIMDETIEDIVRFHGLITMSS